jgi:S1-C subfamily serine protease
MMAAAAAKAAAKAAAATEKGENKGAAASSSSTSPDPATSPSGTPSGVYVSRWHHGSPAHRYGLYALNFVVAVGGVPTPDLDSFVEAVRGLPDGAPVRVALVHLETTKPKVLTLKQDLRYWPTTELRLDGPGRGWERRVISSVEGGACGGVVAESKR